jgi:hypothetical protein
MIRTLALLVFLGACSTPAPVFKTDCPPSVTVPVPTPRRPTQAQKNALEVRVELWAEKLLARGDACADAVRERDKWIRGK